MEAITRTNPWKKEISPSALDTASCMRKYLYDKILGISPDVPKIALSFGTCLHAGIAEYYMNKAKVGHDSATTIGFKAFGRTWAHEACEGDFKRNFATGLAILSEYFKAYENDNVIFVPELVECDQWMELPNGAHLLMKIDRVMNKEGYNTVIDSKSTSMSLTDYYFKSFENALATTLYFWGVAQILGQCDCVLIDAIKVPLAKEPSESFVRRTFIRTDKQVQDAIDTACARTDYIEAQLNEPRTVHSLMKAFSCNQHNCNDYGGCPYLPLCKYGFSHPALTCDFKATNVNGITIMQLAKDEQFSDIDKVIVVEGKDGQNG